MFRRVWWLGLLLALLAGCGNGSDFAALPAPSGESAPRARLESRTLNLREGWNAVAFDCPAPELQDAPQVAGACWFDGRTYQTAAFTSQGVDGRRGYWVFATSAGTLSWTGAVESEATITLRKGWNLVSLAASGPLPGRSLEARAQGQVAALASVMLPVVTEIQADNTYRSVDLSRDGALLGGRPYWMFALADATLTVSPAPAPSPESPVVGPGGGGGAWTPAPVAPAASPAPVASPSPSPVASPSPSPVASPSPSPLASPSPSPVASPQVVAPLTVPETMLDVSCLSTRKLTASGGVPPYSWALVSAASGGACETDGTYRAGASGDVADVVQVKDAAGTTALVTLNVKYLTIRYTQDGVPVTTVNGRIETIIPIGARISPALQVSLVDLEGTTVSNDETIFLWELVGRPARPVNAKRDPGVLEGFPTNTPYPFGEGFFYGKYDWMLTSYFTTHVAGTYTLRISSEGAAPYTFTIEVAGAVQ